MTHILIIDDVTPLPSAAWDLATRNPEVIFIDYKTEYDEMFMSRQLLAAALMSGIVVANQGGQQIPARIAAAAMPEYRGRNKVRSYGSRPCGAAAAKRAKAKRRNIAARASKRRHG